MGAIEISIMTRLENSVTKSKQRLFDNSFRGECEKLTLLDVMYSEFRALQNDIKKVEDTIIRSRENCDTFIVTHLDQNWSRSSLDMAH
jgi:hypothetical protein